MPQLYEDILEYQDHGVPLILETSIIGNTGSIHTNLKRKIQRISKQAEGSVFHVEYHTDSDISTIREPIFPAERLIILGAGHVSRSLCDFASKIGFSVIVCDDRPEFAAKEFFPLASEVICNDFKSSIQLLNITRYDYVAVLTRGHRYDADCLRQILASDLPAYLGLIGSKRRVSGLKELLLEEGFSKEKLDQICSPIGIDIGAITPREIAISICGELISFRRCPERQQKLHRVVSLTDLDSEIIPFLANCHEPQAICTVIEAKGSTPRAAGAKMCVGRLGNVVGSIGGGCSEWAVILEAIRIIGTGTFKIMEIDLTDDIAESEGMVCGGKMKVLIEDIPTPIDSH